MVREVLSLSPVRQFTEYLFDRPNWADRAAYILKAILEARPPRLSDIARDAQEPSGHLQGDSEVYGPGGPAVVHLG